MGRPYVADVALGAESVAVVVTSPVADAGVGSDRVLGVAEVALLEQSIAFDAVEGGSDPERSGPLYSGRQY